MSGLSRCDGSRDTLPTQAVMRVTANRHADTLDEARCVELREVGPRPGRTTVARPRTGSGRTTGTGPSRLIPWWYVGGMSVQMTIRVDDNLAAFVDQAANAGEGSRADVINRAIKREIRRRAAERDAQIYASRHDPELDADAYAVWATPNASQVWSDLD